MPKTVNRSTSKRKLMIRTSSGVKERYVKVKKGSNAKCALTGEKLKGFSKKGSKSERKPSRKFGGNLSPNAVKKVLKYAARVNDKSIKIDDVDPSYAKYVKPLVKNN